MGGGWDATNVADGQVAVVLPIAMDHSHFLDDTLADIAHEKSGIIKPGALVVVGAQEPDLVPILAARAEEVGARMALDGNDFGVVARSVAVGGQQVSIRGLAGDYLDLFLALHGAHQADNAAIAIAAVEAFLGGGQQPLNADVVREAFADVTAPGRLEIVRRSPTVIVKTPVLGFGYSVPVRAVFNSLNPTPLLAPSTTHRSKPGSPNANCGRKSYTRR